MLRRQTVGGSNSQLINDPNLNNEAQNNATNQNNSEIKSLNETPRNNNVTSTITSEPTNNIKKSASDGLQGLLAQKHTVSFFFQTASPTNLTANQHAEPSISKQRLFQLNRSKSEILSSFQSKPIYDPTKSFFEFILENSKYANETSAYLKIRLTVNAYLKKMQSPNNDLFISHIEAEKYFKFLFAYQRACFVVEKLIIFWIWVDNFIKPIVDNNKWDANMINSLQSDLSEWIYENTRHSKYSKAEISNLDEINKATSIGNTQIENIKEFISNNSKPPNTVFNFDIFFKQFSKYSALQQLLPGTVNYDFTKIAEIKKKYFLNSNEEIYLDELRNSDNLLNSQKLSDIILFINSDIIPSNQNYSDFLKQEKAKNAILFIADIEDYLKEALFYEKQQSKGNLHRVSNDDLTYIAIKITENLKFEARYLNIELDENGTFCIKKPIIEWLVSEIRTLINKLPNKKNFLSNSLHIDKGKIISQLVENFKLAFALSPKLQKSDPKTYYEKSQENNSEIIGSPPKVYKFFFELDVEKPEISDDDKNGKENLFNNSNSKLL
ncbi:MAG: hypothetical protein Tsb005_01420 [Gammaproteobacteria bacterium]